MRKWLDIAKKQPDKEAEAEEGLLQWERETITKMRKWLGMAKKQPDEEVEVEEELLRWERERRFLIAHYEEKQTAGAVSTSRAARESFRRSQVTWQIA